jgi:hypothetical protein
VSTTWCRAFAESSVAAGGRPGGGHEWYTRFELLALGFLATTGRSDEITLSLPAELAPPLADALEQLREHATGGRAASFEGLAKRVAAGAPIELTTTRGLLGELLAVAIEDKGDRLSQDGTRLLRGESAAATELRAGLNELGALLDLLETVLP